MCAVIFVEGSVNSRLFKPQSQGQGVATIEDPILTNYAKKKISYIQN